jgi:hypothetical protein
MVEGPPRKAGGVDLPREEGRSDYSLDPAVKTFLDCSLKMLEIQNATNAVCGPEQLLALVEIAGKAEKLRIRMYDGWE